VFWFICFSVLTLLLYVYRKHIFLEAAATDARHPSSRHKSTTSASLVVERHLRRLAGRHHKHKRRQRRHWVRYEPVRLVLVRWSYRCRSGARLLAYARSYVCCAPCRYQFNQLSAHSANLSTSQSGFINVLHFNDLKVLLCVTSYGYHRNTHINSLKIFYNDVFFVL
jgi:hypothetical protein